MDEVIQRLEATIQDRKTRRPEDSYTARLLSQGTSKIAQKVGEEGVEVVIASLVEDPDRLKSEMADLIYHCLVLLAARDMSWRDVQAELEKRAG